MNARVTLMLATVLGRSLPAQTPAPVAPASEPAPVPQAQGEKPPEPQEQPYNYAPEGRRDPFVSLVSRGTQSTGVVRTGSSTGVGGLTTGEISVRGVVQSRGSYIAMVQGPDGKTYIVHVNDRLVDGVVKQITPQGLVLVQEVNDPLSVVKQREVRKNLRSAEEGK
jgi:hypothetical protein